MLQKELCLVVRPKPEREQSQQPTFSCLPASIATLLATELTRAVSETPQLSLTPISGMRTHPWLFWLFMTLNCLCWLAMLAGSV